MMFSVCQTVLHYARPKSSPDEPEMGRDSRGPYMDCAFQGFIWVVAETGHDALLCATCDGGKLPCP